MIKVGSASDVVAALAAVAAFIMALLAYQEARKVDGRAQQAWDAAKDANDLAGRANELAENAVATSVEANSLARSHHEEDAASDARRARAEDTVRALDLCREVTSMDVLRAIRAAETDQDSKRFVVALFNGCAASFDMLRSLENVEPNLEKALSSALEELKSVDPRATKAAAGVITRKRKTDRSAYAWDGAGSFTKHQVLQKLALDHLDHHPSGLTDFRESLGKLMAQAADRSDRRLDPSRLLVPLNQADPWHLSVAEKVGALDLDGGEYVVSNTVGYPAADYAQQTQIPIIRWFIANGDHVTAIPPGGAS